MNYPNNIKKEFKQTFSHSNRGMDLEDMINRSNEYYLQIDKAVIYKKPTPIGVVDVAYTNHSKKIRDAYFKMPSTLDYNGLYKGCYIDFEAKVTKNKTSFPLSNIHMHQIQHIRNILRHGGICFLIVQMNGFVYLLKGEDFLSYIDTMDRKSITYDYISKKGHVVKIGFNPSLDYLKVVDEIYFEGDMYGKEKSCWYEESKK